MQQKKSSMPENDPVYCFFLFSLRDILLLTVGGDEIFIDRFGYVCHGSLS